jgi:hypothetical protein
MQVELCSVTSLSLGLALWLKRGKAEAEASKRL